MEKYVHFIQNHRKQLLVLLVVINILALIGLFQIKINPDFQVFVPTNSTHKEILDDMNQVFETSDQIMFLLETDQPNMTAEIVNDFRNFQDFLEKVDEIQHVKGPTPEKVVIGSRIIDIESITSTDLKHLEEYYSKIRDLSPVIKKNGKLFGAFTIFPNQGFNHEELNSIEKYLKDQKIKYFASGDIYMQQKIIDYILIILLLIPPVAIILILTVFKLQMGSLKATIFSIIPAGIAALWTMGLVGWIGEKVSIITVLAPIFTIVIGSADGLHFVSHVQEERDKGTDRIESIVETLKMVGIPMIITTVTSMAGFLSLLVMNTDAIKDLATFAAIGIFLAGAATWYVLPVILTGDISLKKPKKLRKPLTTGIRRLWGYPAIGILIIILIISAVGFNWVSTEFNQLMIYRNYTSVHRGFEKIMEVNNGSVPVYLYIKTEADPLDPMVARNLLELENTLVNSRYVGKVMSVYDFYSVMYSLFMNKDKPEYPGQLIQVNLISNMMNQMIDNPTSHLLNREKRINRMMVFPVDLENKTLDQINKLVEDFNNSHDNMDIKITGVQYLMRDLNESMIDNQTSSSILAFSLIFALLYISLKKFKPSVVSLLPIGFTVFFLYGFLGLSGISLNVFTTTIFSITIGVGIDYAIHFTSVWMSFKKKGYNSNEAAEMAYNYTSRPILANAFGLAIGLSALLLSPLRIHLFVSVLMWASMISGVFFSLSFLPTVLRKMK